MLASIQYAWQRANQSFNRFLYYLLAPVERQLFLGNFHAVRCTSKPYENGASHTLADLVVPHQLGNRGRAHLDPSSDLPATPIAPFRGVDQ